MLHRYGFQMQSMPCIGLPAVKPGRISLLARGESLRSKAMASHRRAPKLPKGSLTLRCHAGHSHSHSHDGAGSTHSHEIHDHPSKHETRSAVPSSCCGGGLGVGHSHDHSHVDPKNPLQRVLKFMYDLVGLTKLAEWLGSSNLATVGKLVGIAIAGVAAWLGVALQAQAAVAAHQVSLAATCIVYVLAGVPALVELSYDITALKVDTHVLMTLSALGTLWSGYAIEGALLLVLFQTSHSLEHLLTHKAQGNLKALYDTIPTAAVLVQVGKDGAPDLGSAQKVKASDVAVGSLMLVKPGEQIPLDGVITHGRAMVSSEHITGESLPVMKREGEEVPAGSLNRDGLLVVKATRPSAESTPARIAKLTLDAQASRPQLRTWLDDFGAAYSKLVVVATAGVLAVLLGSGVPLLGSAAGRGAFYRAMGFLTVASPCALVMVPLAYVSAIAAIASRGILVKGGRVLDALSSCTTVAFDKTGTLTTGSLLCTSLTPMHTLDPLGQTQGAHAAAAAAGGGGGGGGNGRGQGVKLEGSWGGGLLGGKPGAVRALRAAVALSQRSTHPVSEAVVLLGEGRGWVLRAGGGRLQAGGGGGVEGTISSSNSSSSREGNGSSNGSSSSSSSGGGNLKASTEASPPPLEARPPASCEQAEGGFPPSRCWFGALDYVRPQLTAAELAAIQRQVSAQGQVSTSVLSVLVMAPAEEAGAEGGAQQAQRGVWVFQFEDSVRQQSAAAVATLQEGSWSSGAASLSRALQVLMLTGDNPSSAARIARRLGITHVHAGLTPEQKLGMVEELKGKKGGGVIMVGDGINDAPALATADVGIAIASTATAAASAAADAIVLNSSGISAVPFMLAVARDTQIVIRQNLILAAASIVALVVPTVTGAVPLWVAVFIHEGSTLLVALNSLRPLRHAARFAGSNAAEGLTERVAGESRAGGPLAPSGELLSQAASVATMSPSL